MKTLKEKIEVMQAALEGKEIEILTFDMNKWELWNDNPQKLEFNWGSIDYRIKEKKKKPREFLLQEMLKPGSLQEPPLYGPIVKVVEVLPK